MLRQTARRVRNRFLKTRFRRRKTSSPVAAESLESRALLSAVSMIAEEQLMVELINRARANPTAEATLQGIGLNDGISGTPISTAAKQPLAPEQILTDVTAAHSQDMIDRDFFDHVNPDNEDWNDRASAAGYPLQVAENLGVQASTGSYNKTDFTIAMHDWLFGSPSHRINMLTDDHVEVGIGLEDGVFTDDDNLFGAGAGTNFNAWMGTQNFAQPDLMYITGVAYEDTVTNDDFYSVGEGKSGSIAIVSASGTILDATNAVGGYQVAVPAGTYQILFSDGTNTYIADATVVDQNVKVDFETTTAQLVVSADTTTETVTASGTDFNDTITVDSAAKTVTLNGLVNNFSSFASPTFNVDGGDGQDFLVANLTPGNENVSMGPDLASNLVVTGASTITGNAEIVKAYSKGGTDTAHLYDQAASDDVFIAKPDLSYMLHDGSMGSFFQNYAYDFESVVGHATGSPGGFSDNAGDIAQLYDTSGDDFATAWPTAARLTDSIDGVGRTYFSYATDFDYVNFWATAGGTDTAEFYDAASDDLYVSRVTSGNHFQTYLRDQAGTDFYNVANRFDRTTAYSATGGNDVAQFYDTFGNDLFVANGPNDAYMNTGGSLFSYAKSFEQTIAFSTRGGTDSAQFYDGPGNDVFDAYATSSTLQGTGYSHTQSGFDSVLAVARTTYTDSDVLNDLTSIAYTFSSLGAWETINDGSSSGPVPRFSDAGSSVNSAASTFDFDADGDGKIQPLTDGLIILKHMAGFEDLRDFAEGLDLTTVLDVDGDGTVAPLTDGMLVLRFIAGFRGEALTQDAVNDEGIRTAAAEIEAWLSPFMTQLPGLTRFAANATDSQPDGPDVSRFVDQINTAQLNGLAFGPMPLATAARSRIQFLATGETGDSVPTLLPLELMGDVFSHSLTDQLLTL